MRVYPTPWTRTRRSRTRSWADARECKWKKSWREEKSLSLVGQVGSWSVSKGAALVSRSYHSHLDTTGDRLLSSFTNKVSSASSTWHLYHWHQHLSISLPSPSLSSLSFMFFLQLTFLDVLSLCCVIWCSLVVYIVYSSVWTRRTHLFRWQIFYM